MLWGRGSKIFLILYEMILVEKILKKKNEEGVKAIRGKTRDFLYFILGSTWGLLNVAQ